MRNHRFMNARVINVYLDLQAVVGKHAVSYVRYHLILFHHYWSQNGFGNIVRNLCSKT